MKFSLLSIGQRFEYQGEPYVKVTPMVAHHAESGKPRLIPRSAHLTLQNEATEAAQNHSSPSLSLSAKTLHAALDEYHKSLETLIQQFVNDADAQQAAALKDQLTAARARLFDRLDLTQDT